MDYFVFRETSNNGWTICPKHDLFGNHCIKGSYALFAARIYGLSWPNWLRLCQQNGATLYGKGVPYVHAVWKEPNKDFLKQLNRRVSDIAAKIDLKELDW